MTIDESIINKKKKIDEWEQKLFLTAESDTTHINDCAIIISGYKQEIEWLEELKTKRKMLDFLFNSYNKAIEDCLDKFADILSNINEMCGKNCPVNCNWGTTFTCKDMCKKWLIEQFKEVKNVSFIKDL